MDKKQKQAAPLNMLSGNTGKTIIAFAVPIILGNIFQQLYNTSDAVIVGRMIGQDGLAAVGVANPIMSIVIFFIFGICIGMSVLMAQFYGKGDYKALKEEASTALIAGVVFTILLSVLCFFLSRPILILTKTPPEILNDADAYLKIIFVGLIFSFLYNYYSAALRAIGDSKTPFLFLLLSSVLNVILDIVFIAAFHKSVASAAVATVISQAVSSVLCMVYVYRKKPMLSLGIKEFVFKSDILINTVRYSSASAFQQTFIYVGRLLVQSTVNPYGGGVIAGYNAATRIESFCFAPIEGLSASESTYCAQNRGAGKTQRVKDGWRISLKIAIIYAISIGALLYLLAPFIMKIFLKDPSAVGISVGSGYLKRMAFFYLLGDCGQITQGFFRGVGELKVTMAVSGIQILVRVVLSYILVPMIGIFGVCYATSIGWAVMVTFIGIFVKTYFPELIEIRTTS